MLMSFEKTWEIESHPKSKPVFEKYWFHTASFLKYVWPFFNIMNERLGSFLKKALETSLILYL